MARFKRGRVWWADFTVHGNRFRKSLGTTDCKRASDKEKDLIAEAKQGKLAAVTQRFSKLAFSQASDVYLAEKLAYVAKRTIQTERERMKPLKGFFGLTPLNRISADSIRQNVVARKAANLCNRTINMEVAYLARILKRGKLWQLYADEIKRLPERHDIGRVLNPEQKEAILTMASNRPEWQIAYLAMTLALNTTMRACEIRGLRWRDVDLIERVLTVRRNATKTDAGERIIPLNSGAWAVILESRERARLLFGSESQPGWYVFPHAEGLRNPDPTKPMTGWRTAWRSLTRAINCPICGKQQKTGEKCRNVECGADISKVKSPLHGLRFHDLRHHAITELSESQASDQTIMSIAGHVSARMLAHYSHVRLEAKRNALECLSRRLGYVTIDVTNEAKKQKGKPQLVENMVDVGRFELPTPCLQSRCSPS